MYLLHYAIHYHSTVNHRQSLIISIIIIIHHPIFKSWYIEYHTPMSRSWNLVSSEHGLSTALYP